MSSRYFYGENADRPLRVGGDSFPFTIISRSAGTAQGVIVIEEGQVTEAFLAVAATYGIEEIDQSAYDAAIVKKKKTRHLPVSVERRPPQNAALKGNGRAVVVPGNSVEKPKTAAELLPEGIDEAVLISTAAPPTENAANAALPRANRGPRPTRTTVPGA